MAVEIIEYSDKAFATNVLQLPEGRDFNHKINLER